MGLDDAAQIKKELENKNGNNTIQTKITLSKPIL